eukprot:TRINITY_DN11631_c0_g1_i3.p1 TRINITY_DN11631_c0_g1~~TRINITY_DN11631_c0_g1_i3.p1  ORF type:complete len:461 (-),score=61.14 TRINITY_DN11631_c0_g1_i3:167-1549(-)
MINRDSWGYYSPRVHEYNCVLNVLGSAGVRRTDAKTAKANCLIWGGIPKEDDIRDFHRFVRVHHFTKSVYFDRKDLLWRCIRRLQSRTKCGEIMPTTFEMPREAGLLKQRMSECDGMWIWKPAWSACGRGIRLLVKGNSVPETGIVQRYISDPLLINGFKFDLRLYVLVTSYCPLRIYLYEDGLVRLATRKYTPKAKTAGVREMHLTNYSIQKYVETDHDGDSSNSPPVCKWSLSQLDSYLQSIGVNSSEVHAKIHDVIVKTIIAVEADIYVRAESPSFELYGFDVLVDSELKPWLLEVNIYPSLSSSSELDRKVKTMLICDTFTLLGFPAFCSREEEERARGIREQKRQQRPQSATRRPRSAGPLRADTPVEFSEGQWDAIQTVVEESMRCGRYVRLYPTSNPVGLYAHLFATPRTMNQVIDDWLRYGGPQLFTEAGRTMSRVAVPSTVPVINACARTV